jgi:hypothetical protein
MVATGSRVVAGVHGVSDVLECQVGRALVGIPRAHVGQIVEYPLVPLPLPARYVGGVGLFQERVLVSIALVPVPGGRARSTRGVLLSGGEPGVGWVLEVASVGGFVPVSVADPGERSAGDKVPAWILRARTSDGRHMAWLDVPTMLRELAGGAGA